MKYLLNIKDQFKISEAILVLILNLFSDDALLFNSVTCVKEKHRDSQNSKMSERILQIPAICAIQYQVFKTFGQTTNRLWNEIRNYGMIQ